ncbi:type II secretion system protein GspD [Deinococcus sonorensis]|uniref:Secretin N-terminal domain-containing protein n=2 Tax=Deinococcus sonorensis TaxID=309891 RepID=A0AAU7U6Q6_9DEIO
MKNRTLTLVLTAALGLASAQTSGSTPAASTPDTRLAAANVSLEIGTYSGPLSSMLAAVAKAAGYDVIFDTNVDALAGAQGTTPSTPDAGARPVVYNFRNTPFNQVWPLLMDVYGLNYQVTTLGQTRVIRVGTQPVQQIIALPPTLDSTLVANQVKRAFGSVVRTTQTTGSNAAQNGASTTAQNTVTSAEDVVLDSPTLKIVPLTSPNGLIVRGTSKEVLQVEALTQTIIKSQPAALAPVVPSAPAPVVQQVYTVKGQQADAVSVLAAQFPTLRVTPVGQTGQLILNGTQAQLTAALGLLGQVDRAPGAAPTTVQRIFQLVNAQADDVKSVLEGTLQRDLTSTGLVGNATPVVQADGTTVIQTPSSATPSTPASSASTAGTASAATIIADKRTNTLIVRGSQQQVTQIAEIIPTLDVKVPQINVQVRIQEIGETASRSLGVDWKAGFGNFVVSLASGKLSAVFDPTQSLMGFNLGATLNALEDQSLTKRVYDGSVTMQSGQRSLGSSGGTENASSSAAAHIQSGGRLELNIPSSAANVPAISKQIDYGVTLDFFSPQVAPDGTITLRVRGVVNNLNSAITPSEVPNILQFTNSEAQTTITFKPGETVLLSGLLGTNTTSTSSGLPFLSSLPVVGPLFGQKSTRTERTQLLVVITGDVLK